MASKSFRAASSAGEDCSAVLAEGFPPDFPGFAAAAEAVEEYAKEHPETRLEIGRIGRRIVDSGNLGNYGTAEAQEYIRKWAEEYTDSDGDDADE